MTILVELYGGTSAADARLIAFSAEPQIVADVSQRLLREEPPSGQDPVVSRFQHGDRAALRIRAKEFARHE
jgi:hypothetical protein